ncbi:MAG: radical SAM protein [bacterium]
MKILFARPNSPLVVTPVPVGFGYLSHAVKEARGDEVRVMDGRHLRLSLEEFIKRTLAWSPDVVGFTAMSFEAREVIDHINRLKAAAPSVTVLLGGPHATGYGPELLGRCRADYLVLGEGERTLVHVLDSLEGKDTLEDKRGVAFRSGKEIVYNGPPDPVEDMESLQVDWEVLDPESYFGFRRRNAMNTVARSGRRLPIFFSRGCPFGCAYCHHIFGRKYRTFDPAGKAAEMQMLRDRYGVTEFEIIDDTFNLKLDHAKAAMQEIVDRIPGAALAFTNGLRADRMDAELLALMKRAGVYRIDYAIESAVPRVQKLIRKNLDLDRAREVVNMTAGERIITGTYNMIGFPTETKEEMEKTVEFAASLKNHIGSFFCLMPFPGTEIAESDPETSRRVRETDFRDASQAAINLSRATDREIAELRKGAYRRFYFSPGRIGRIARDVPKNARFLASALAVLKLSFREGVNY